MARSSMIVALAAGLLIVLSTVSIIFRTYNPDLLVFPWQRDGQRELVDLAQNLSYNPKSSVQSDVATRYLLGVGKGDITGPVVEINFMGYADPNQLGLSLIHI